MKVKEIVWKDGRFSAVYGYIGDIQVAVISYTLTRQDPKPWHLRIEAFGRESRTEYVGVPDAKAAAPGILLAMVQVVTRQETGASVIRSRHGDPLRDHLRDWRPMDTAPTTGPVVWVRVKCRDGRFVDAHFACDLSGEEQPPFRGWFEEVGQGHGRFMSEVFPVGWRPLEAPRPRQFWQSAERWPEYRR